ncbi:ubiquitin--protein ligase [uncultured Clostridium sp.]|uniref:ubiquitin--protein ligase n=1 Tax=uncultured Clostridium sp. TaxID=59620 RepID=UPI0025F1E72B|nr:ubiquitin--protein ligase [uncultured Clostridium sp.]
MNCLKKMLAIYNNPVNFRIKFTAPKLKEIYKSFIIEEELHKALTFNLRNSYIRADGELISGNFKYNDKDKSLRIEIDNPCKDNDVEVEIVIGTNITSLSSLIETNYLISNIAYIKIKGYEDIPDLITKSNLITINFESIKINIYADAIEKIAPAVDGESIKLSASFITLDTDVSYDITVENDIGENLIFDETMSSLSIDGQKLESADFHEDNNIVSIKISNSQEVRNKNIKIIIGTKIKNPQKINDVLINRFTLSINDIECSSDIIKIPLIKPILNLRNDIITAK